MGVQIPVTTLTRYRPRKSGFTLIELCVVVAIITVLLALLLPAVQRVRESARQTQCRNNLRQIGIALQNYHSTLSCFPPGGLDWRAPWPKGGTSRNFAWSALLLPWLDQNSIYQAMDLNVAFDAPGNAAATATRIPVFLCPSTPDGDRQIRDRGPTAYGGIYGERISGPNSPPRGLMVYDRAFQFRDIIDGASNTLIVGEDSARIHVEWVSAWNVFDQAFAINRAPAFENDLRSLHPGGVFVALADGSVRFAGDSMDLSLLAALCTRSGREVTGEW